jgi:ribosomal protein L21E
MAAKKAAKVAKVMREYKKGELHSGKKGPVVKSRKQAVAIALSEAGMSKKKTTKSKKSGKK